jgi:heme-degrading monooxygenase HmoA
MIVKTPNPPYYAVIFTSIREDRDDGYSEKANEMLELASEQEGFLGMESARSELGISVSYWDSLDSIQKWSRNTQHVEAKEMGKSGFYKEFKTRICKVERAY